MTKKERNENEPTEVKFFICFILMTIAFVTFNFMSSIELNFAGYTILANTFLYPFVFLFSTMITRDYGREKALTAVLLTALLQTGIYIGINLSSTTDIEALNVTGNIVAFLISQIAIIFLYHSIDKDTKLTSKAGLFVLYVFAILIAGLITSRIFNVEPIANFEMVYSISCAIQSLVALAIIYIQYLIEKERIK